MLVFIVKNPPKTPGDLQKNPPSPGVLNAQSPAPIPRHGVGPPGDDGAPTPGLASLNEADFLIYDLNVVFLKRGAKIVFARFADLDFRTMI